MPLCNLPAFLYALGIPNVGVKLARVLALDFGTLQALREADEANLTVIADVGAVVARSIVGFFKDERISAEVDHLLELGVAPKPMERVEKTAHPLSGKTVVFTGTLSKIDRKEAEEIVLSLGGKASSSVSAKTHLVVAGEKAGSKLEKARALGVNVIDEDEFLKMVDEH